MSLEVLDPTHETDPPPTHLPAVPKTLRGGTVGFVCNGKEGTRGFFTHLERLLRERLGVARVELRVKGNYSAPAPAAIVAETAAWDLTVTGLGD